MRHTFSSYMITSFLSLLTIFCACEDESFPIPAEYEHELASIVFSTEIPNPKLETKGFGDYETPPQDTRDNLLDGQAFYRLTVLLIDLDQSELVAFKDLYPESNDLSEDNMLSSKLEEDFYSYPCFRSAKLTFSNEGKTESNNQLQIGHYYRLIAVANCTALHLQAGFNDETGTDETPISITYNDYLTDEIEVIKAFFQNNSSKRLSTTDSKFKSLFNKTIQLPSTSNICTEEAMPLSLVTDFQLQTGVNHISTHLKRVFARLRIAVKNTSSHSSLKVTTLELNQFTQNKTYIFDDPDQPDRKYNNTTAVSPDVTSETATKPFVNCIIPRNSTISIFDGYIPESKLDFPYKFKLTMEYVNFNLQKETITTTENLRDGATYLIFDPLTNSYLRSNENKDKVICEQIAEETILSKHTEPYVWIFHKDYKRNRGKHRLQSVETSKFIGFRYELYTGLLENFIRLDTRSYYFTSDYLNLLLQTDQKGGITISRNVFFYTIFLGSSYIYLDHNNNLLPVEAKHDTIFKTLFHFQEVIQGIHSQPREETITPDLKEIKRNDFVQLLVTANFNP